MKRLLWLLLIAGILAISCTTGGKMGKSKVSANQYYQQGNYQAALMLWESDMALCVKKGMEDDCPAYTPAAYAYMKMGNDQKALELLKKASYSAIVPDSTYLAMADIYNKEDNLSLEMMSLQDYISRFPNGKKAGNVNARLFKIYVESLNWESAENQWANLDEADQKKEMFLQDYFSINKASQKNETCDSLAIVLLKVNANDLDALDWLGKKYYRLAEDSYQSEMQAYESNKTRKQYAILLKALDEITAQFKVSLSYFKQAYQLSPDPRTANYLSHIYNRLDDKDKATYYGKQAEK
jgi:hypothetical protein